MLGLSTPHGDGVAELAFFGLYALQHRGQEAAGIAVSDGHRARLHKDSGLVSQIFTPERLPPLVRLPRHRPHPVLDHRRLGAAATPSRSSSRSMHGPLAVAHNGNLVNAPALRDELLGRGFGLTATSDTEVLTLMLAAAGGRTWEERLERTLPAWKGAYSLVRARRRSGRSPFATRGASARCRSAGCPTAGGPSPRRPARCTPSVAATSARSSPARSSPCRAPRSHRRQVARAGAEAGPLHVRVRVLLPSRLGVGRPQRAPRPPATRRGARRRVPGRRRRRDPGSRLLDPGGHRVRPPQRASRSTTG